QLKSSKLNSSVLVARAVSGLGRFLFAATTTLEIILALLPNAHRTVVHNLQVHLMADQITNVIDAILDHGGSLEAQSPAEHIHILGQSHWSKHLGPKDA